MSYSSHRRDALDSSKPLEHRLSHARSCAMLMGEKYGVPRSIITRLVGAAGVDLDSVASDSEIVEAIRILDWIKLHGLKADDAV